MHHASKRNIHPQRMQGENEQDKSDKFRVWDTLPNNYLGRGEEEGLL